VSKTGKLIIGSLACATLFAALPAADFDLNNITAPKIAPPAEKNLFKLSLNKIQETQAGIEIPTGWEQVDGGANYKAGWISTTDLFILRLRHPGQNHFCIIEFSPRANWDSAHYEIEETEWYISGVLPSWNTISRLRLSESKSRYQQKADFIVDKQPWYAGILKLLIGDYCCRIILMGQENGDELLAEANAFADSVEIIPL
jgi:hypothetical protein